MRHALWVDKFCNELYLQDKILVKDERAFKTLIQTQEGRAIGAPFSYQK